MNQSREGHYTLTSTGPVHYSFRSLQGSRTCSDLFDQIDYEYQPGGKLLKYNCCLDFDFGSGAFGSPAGSRRDPAGTHDVLGPVQLTLFCETAWCR